MSGTEISENSREREEWSPSWEVALANGTEEASSLSSEEEEVEGERENAGYILLPQDPEEDQVNSDRGVGEVGDEDMTRRDDEGEGEPETMVRGSVPDGVSPRLSRWMEKQMKELAVTDSNPGHREEGGGGRGGDDWAKFSETPTSTCDGQDEWPLQSSAPDERAVMAAESSVEPSSTLQKEEEAAIKAAMSGFSLPTSAMPSWAHTVPESVWKAELISGLKEKKSRNKKK